MYYFPLQHLWNCDRVFQIHLFFSFCMNTFVMACTRLSSLEMLVFIQEGAQHCLLQLKYAGGSL